MNSTPLIGEAVATARLAELPFSTSLCDALFAAVLIDDDIHLDAELPAAIDLALGQDQLVACYRLCEQLWIRGVDYRELRATCNALCFGDTPSPEAQLAFKHARAKFKHLRFAYASFGVGHRYPKMFHRLTAVMGYLQDAFKNKQRAATVRFAILLRLFLTNVSVRAIGMEIRAWRPTSADEFVCHLRDEVALIKARSADEEVTSREFHELRKIISRLAALYSNMVVLFPSEYHARLSRYVNTINGLMGQIHDELIEKKFDMTHDYYADKFTMPAQVRQRLVALVEHFGDS